MSLEHAALMNIAGAIDARLGHLDAVTDLDERSPADTQPPQGSLRPQPPDNISLGHSVLRNLAGHKS